MFVYLVADNDSKFLEEDPETFYTIDNVFSTSEQVDQVLVGAIPMYVL